MSDRESETTGKPVIWRGREARGRDGVRGSQGRCGRAGATFEKGAMLMMPVVRKQILGRGERWRAFALHSPPHGRRSRSRRRNGTGGAPRGARGPGAPPRAGHWSTAGPPPLTPPLPTPAPPRSAGRAPLRQRARTTATAKFPGKVRNFVAWRGGRAAEMRRGKKGRIIIGNVGDENVFGNKYPATFFLSRPVFLGTVSLPAT